MRITVEHVRTGDGNVVVQVTAVGAVGVAGIVTVLPQDRRRAIQLLDALLDELWAAVDAALGAEQ